MKLFKSERQKKREQILEDIQNKLDEQIKKFQQHSDENSQKNFCKLIELMNAAIRLEQAEKRFGVNLKIAIFSVIAPIITSSITTIIVQRLTHPN